MRASLVSARALRNGSPHSSFSSRYPAGVPLLPGFGKLVIDPAEPFWLFPAITVVLVVPVVGDAMFGQRRRMG